MCDFAVSNSSQHDQVLTGLNFILQGLIQYPELFVPSVPMTLDVDGVSQFQDPLSEELPEKSASYGWWQDFSPVWPSYSASTAEVCGSLKFRSMDDPHFRW